MVDRELGRNKKDGAAASPGGVSVRRPARIVVLGPPNSGKSFLVATHHKAMLAGAVGYSDDWSLDFQPDASGTTDPDPVDGSPSTTKIRGLRRLESRFAELLFPSSDGVHRKGFMQSASREAFEFDEYRLRICLYKPLSGFQSVVRRLRDLAASRQMLEKPDHKQIYEYEIWDPSGSLSVDEVMSYSIPKGLSESSHGGNIQPETIRDAREKFTRRLAEADHIVLCRPIYVRGASVWDTSYAELLSHIREGRFGSFGSITIAFTFYDLMFLADPGYPLLSALSTGRAMDCISRALRTESEFRLRLEALNRERFAKIWAMPVSSYGFLISDGRPNLDPWVRAPAQSRHYEHNRRAPLLRPDLYHAQPVDSTDAAVASLLEEPTARAEGERRFRDEWWPFLTADPFITCATGHPSNLMFELGQILEYLKHDRERYVA